MAEPKTCDLIVHNGVLVTMDAGNKVYRRGAVATAGSRILAAGEEQAILAAYRAPTMIDAKEGIIHPGFIDAHCHVNIHVARGVLSDNPRGGHGPSVEDWYLAMEEGDEVMSAKLIALELLRNGYTCFAEPGSTFATDAVAAAVNKIGPRIALAEPLLWDQVVPGEKPVGRMKRAPTDLDRCLKLLGNQLWRNKDPEGLSHGYVALNNLSNASDELILAALETARSAGAALGLHHNRTLALAARDDRRFGTPNLQHLYDRGMLDACCSFTHMNVIRDEEMDAVVKSGMSIIWAPGNTMYYGVNTEVKSPIPELLARGVTVATGVDQAKAWTFSDMELLGYLMLRSEGSYISPIQMMEMRTRSAAKALGLAKEIGSIEPGKRADIVVRSNQVPEAWPGVNLAQDMMLSVRSKNVDTTVVNGRIVYRDGRPTEVDSAEIFAEVKTRMAALFARSGLTPERHWGDV